jgi:predicted transcriptional regulator
MNVTNYDIGEVINIRPISDKSHNRDVDSAKITNDIINEKVVKQEKEKILQAVTMDVNEVKDFLFMLIGAGVKVKPENDNSGVLINRLV